jgi:hypothetical protein
MALPISGNISMSQIRDEFATEASPGVGPGSISSYYRNKVYGGTPGVIYPGLGATTVPFSGPISYSRFFQQQQQLANRLPMAFQAVDGANPARRWAYQDTIAYNYSGGKATELFNLRTASATNGPVFNAPANGRYCEFLNNYGVWQDSSGATYFDRSYTVNFPRTANYSFTGSVDNYGTVFVDSNAVLDINAGDAGGYQRTHTVTQRITAGVHTIRVYGVNTGGPGSFALSISSAQSFSEGVQEFDFQNARFVKIEVWGAQGSTNGGYGGYASGYYAGSGKLYVVCGGVGVWSEAGAGGFNGGGAGGVGGNGARGGGGGATDVRTADSLASRIIVAGGGGAGLYWRGMTWRGGGGGGSVGDTGLEANNENSSGYGGTQTSGGGGIYTQGSGFGQGGQSIGYSNGYNTISGGGGGWYGGGAGNAAGGGSGYVGGVLDGTMANDVNTDAGRAVITIYG